MSNYTKPSPQTLHDLNVKAWSLVAEAEEAGVVVCIESVPSKPLAMGYHWMNATVRPARACHPRPPETTTAEELAWLANYRLKRFIDMAFYSELEEMRDDFAQTAREAASRTHHTALDAMRRQGRAWPVKPFQRYRRTA